MLHVYTMKQDIYTGVITRQANPTISKFSRPCNEFMSVWTMFPYNKSGKCNTSNTAINGLF